MKVYMRWVGMALMCVSVLLWAKDKKARSYNSFYELLAKSPYTVVLFYNSKNDTKENTKDLLLMFRSLSDDPEYKDADLLFMRADLSRDKLQSLSRTFDINGPAVQLFIGRQPITGARIDGLIDRTGITHLINRFLSQKISEYLKEKDEARKRALEDAKIRAYNRAYYWEPYWYYGYPYGPYGYWGYGYGPRYGFYYGW